MSETTSSAKSIKIYLLRKATLQRPTWAGGDIDLSWAGLPRPPLLFFGAGEMRLLWSAIYWVS